LVIRRTEIPQQKSGPGVQLIGIECREDFFLK